MDVIRRKNQHTEHKKGGITAFMEWGKSNREITGIMKRLHKVMNCFCN